VVTIKSEHRWLIDKNKLKTFLFFIILFSAMLIHKSLYAACPVDPGSSFVTMGDSSSTLTFTYTNNTGSSITNGMEIEFETTNYEFLGGMSLDPCWVLDEADGKKIKFQCNCATCMATGASSTFQVTAAWDNNVPFPSAATDQTDSLSQVEVKDSFDYIYNAANPCGRRQQGNQPLSCPSPGGCTTFASWPRKSLHVAITATPDSVGIGGSITVSMVVVNRSTSNGVVVRPCLSASSGIVSLSSGPTPATLTLNSGQSGIFTWTYTANSSGTVNFTGSAGNGACTGNVAGGTITSGLYTSNSVVIGSFTATLSVSPSSTISGNSVTVTITVQNNSGSDLLNIVPTLTPQAGGATETCGSPSPASLNKLKPGNSTVFQWSCTVTGNPNDIYAFTGSATSSTLSTNTASASGTIGSYSITYLGSSAASAPCGQTPPPAITLTWQICNNTGDSIDKVEFDPLPSGWIASSATPAAYCQVRGGGTNVECDDNNLVPNGQCIDFTITFSNYPNDVSDRYYSFPVSVEGNNIPGTPQQSTQVILSSYKITFYGSGCTGNADCSAIVAKLEKCVSNAWTAQSGQTITFSTTAGTLSSTSQITDASGCTPAISLSDTNSATVTADYLTSASKIIDLNCGGIGGGKIRILRWREVVQ